MAVPLALAAAAKYAIPVISGLATFSKRRKENPDEFFLKTAAAVGAASVFSKPLANYYLISSIPKVLEGGVMQYRMGAADYTSRFRQGQLGGGFRDTEMASMLRNQTIQRGMTSREALAGTLGGEARRFYGSRGVYN